jgi:hypothetical protein
MPPSGAMMPPSWAMMPPSGTMMLPFGEMLPPSRTMMLPPSRTMMLLHSVVPNHSICNYLMIDPLYVFLNISLHFYIFYTLSSEFSFLYRTL